MATVQKKPRKLPKIRQDEKDEEDNKRNTVGRGAASKRLPNPPPGRKRELPPLRRGGKRGDNDTKSMVDMGRTSPAEYANRTSLTATHDAKSCYFYVDDDYKFQPIKVVIHPRKYKKIDTVARDLSVRMRKLPFGVRSIHTPRGQHKIHNLEDLTNDGHYICSSNRKYCKGLDVQRVQSRFVWHHNRPDSGRKGLNNLLRESNLRSAKNVVGFRPGYELSKVYTRVRPKKTVVMKNGEPDIMHSVLLNRKTAQTFEQVLESLSEMFQFAVRRLYTMDGIPISGLQMLLEGPEGIVAGGSEHFIHMSGGYDNHNRTHNQSRAQTRMSMGSQMNIRSRMQNKRDRLSKTKGRWRVTTRTNALPSAGTQAQVTVTVYGTKGNSGPITLGHGDGTNFQPGQVDDFTISVGNVGEVYKIRLAHDNSGDFPGWLCDEVNMRDLDTNEELNFSCRRWLARDEDDQEITRELAVKRPGEPILPLIKYQVDVITGDVWGGGTDANVYITIYGDRGDTGVRQLYAETKGVYFKQGQLDSFEVEAVSLGHLKRLIIGHDGTGPGAGWFLDKIIIREPPFRTNQECVFHCGKWLDEGEDDGKIVRELRVQDEYMDDILEKRNWEFEKWKYHSDSQIVLFSVMTGKAVRMNRDLSVDGVGDEKEKHAIFNVNPKKPMRPMLSSAVVANHFLAVDNGRITGHGKGGPYCELRVRVQQDRTTLFESVKNPLQFLTIGADGATGDPRGLLDKEPSRRFYVYVKGMFRSKGVIMLGTSLLQAVNVVKENNTLTGRGKRGGPQSQFIVHKVSPGGIRMFESVANPGKYIRLRDGKIDCLGDRGEESHFLVLRHKDKGYVTIQSASQRGLFLGMTTDGRIHTTIDTGVRNIWLYPEVVTWGVPKKRSSEIYEEEGMQQRVKREITPELERIPSVETPKPVSQYAEGDWGINVSTITAVKDGDVALVAYGDRGGVTENSGPIILGGPPGRPIFQDGNEDEFRANLLKIGRMFKIRLELIPKSSTRDPSWRVNDVRMQDLNTNEVLKFDFNRFLSREEEDGEIMRELPVQRPGESALPVHHYMVMVYTGKEDMAATEASVYITAHGQKGDWGKRYLIASEKDVKFQKGQVDTFYVEAVSLGELQRCVIGHDGTAAGEGWYLEQIIIKEDRLSTEEYVFPCNRWLDSGMEDRKIERALMVKEPSPSKVRVKAPPSALGKIIEEEASSSSFVRKSPTPDTSKEEKSEEKKEDTVPDKRKYGLEIVTGQESETSNGGKVHITLYGEKGKSEQITLYATNPNSKTFEPGNIDQFQLETPDLGDLYKIRLGREDSDKWNRWFLEEVRMTDEVSDEKMVFSFNRWLARDMDDGDLCRELPVLQTGKPIPMLQVYQVQVHTGDHWGAATDANMYITIYGTKGDGGKRLLHKCVNNRVKFRRGQFKDWIKKKVDTFEFDIVDLNELTSVVVSHDGRGHGAGVFVDKVIVKEKDTDRSHLQYVFASGRWLDTHEDDCVTERTLRMIDVIDTNIPPPPKQSNKSSGSWSVTLKTSNMDKAATTARVYLTVYGTSGHSDKLKLTSQDPSADSFTQGAESEFQVQTGDIGRMTKIRLEHDNTGANPDMRVDYVKMTDADTGEELVFYLDRWLAIDRDDGNILREMPVIRKGTPCLPVLRYIVAITTGSYKDAGTDRGNVSINVIGVDGDTGLRELNGAISKNRLPWQSGQTDIYVIEAASVGRVKKVELNLKSTGQDRWYVQQVSIAEGARADSQFVVYCHQWLISSDTQVSEFPVAEIQPSTNLIEILESIPKGLEKPVRSKGKWTVYVQTGTQNDSGTKEKVCLVLCGLKGESESVCVNSKEDLNPGSLVKFEAKVGDIGLLFKIRVYFQDKHQGSSWFLAKMKLKDHDTGEEFILEHNDWIESTNENPEGALELPLSRPDLQPLKEQIYIITVKTGDLPRAETEANIFCNLIGQWGSSGQRSLSVSSNKECFRAGQEDTFTLTCIELGNLQKVIIGHDNIGRGQGWYCEYVNVKVAEETDTIFPCNRWLDTGCDDRKLTAELLPLSKLPLTATEPTRYTQSDGEWNIHVTTAGLDQLSMLKPGTKAGEVSIVVYGTESVKGPIQLVHEDPDSPVALLAPGKTEHFYDYEFKDLGEIEKIRVSSGYEGDTEAVWTIEKVVLEEHSSHESLTFDFGAWVGEVGGDIRKEMPLVKPDKSNREIVKYYIEVYTSEAEMNASTNANVFVTLYGYNSDSGRRHLIHSKNSDKRFQTGQVDKFEVEAVDLGNLEKIVVAKGPGKPWLLEKIVVKRGQFASEEHVFMFQDWIGDKSRQQEEIEETLKPTAIIPSAVSIPIEDATDLEPSRGSWAIESVTGGRRGPDGPLDLVVVFCGQNAESKPLPLQSNKNNPFQIGLTDNFKVQYTEKIGELRKVRLGFMDQSVIKAWYVRKITFEDTDAHDMFWADLNDWVAIDQKLDGWKEFPVPWPAVHIPPVLVYLVTVQLGQVNPDSADNEVYVYMYGDQGGTGKRLLKHSTTNTDKFKENQVDVFEVEAVQLGDLVKIVIGHNNTEKGGGWYLERVIVQESKDADKILFPCNRWFDTGEGEGLIEHTLLPDGTAENISNNAVQGEEVPEVQVPLVSTIPASPEREPTPDREPTPVRVPTPEREPEPQREPTPPREPTPQREPSPPREPTPAREPTPEREPTPPREPTPTREPTPPREPTPVREQTPVREPTPVRERTPAREPTPEVEEQQVEAVKQPTPPPKDAKYSITTTTGGDAGEGTNSAIVVVMYGDKGQSKPYLIGEEPDFRFSMGETDNFEIIVGEEVGDLYKVRLGFHDEESHQHWYTSIDDTPTWFLEKLTIRNEVDMKVYEFEAGIWVRLDEYQDFWRELPVKKEEELEVYQYNVSVFTGDESKSGTDANVYLQIFGECGDTGYRRLMASRTHTNKFEQGNKDVFTIGAVDLGKLTKIKIKHDGSGPGSGWLLDRVVIKESEETTIRYVFRYERWLDEGDGENGVEQTLMLSEILVSDEEEAQQEDLPGYPWKVETITGGEAPAGTQCPVELVLYQENGKYETVIVGERQGFQFKPGASDIFNVRVMEELGDLYKVRVGFHGADSDKDWLYDYSQSPTWLLDQLRLTDESKDRTYDITSSIWLKMDAYQDFWREQPIKQADGRAAELYQYRVEVYTGAQSKAGTDADVYLCIHGNKGDTGLRRLMASKTNTNKFEQGNCDIFELNAVDLGDLTKVKVSHDGAGLGSGWFLEKVIVKTTEDSQTRYVFNCNNWLDVDEGEMQVSQEFPLTEVLEGEEEQPEETLSGNPWTVWSVTGADVGEGTDSPVELILYGDKGHSQPVIIGGEEDFRFNKGQVDVFEVRVEGEVGQLYKVRVGFHGNKYDVPWYSNYHMAPSWFLESLKLKDETVGMEYEMEAGVSVQAEKYMDFWREIPVAKTENKLSVYMYQVEVYTGEQFKAGTDANVSIQIYGERGDTGLRRLMDSKTNSNKFEVGEKDVFDLPAVDLGQLLKVKVTHDASGAGSGWLLDKVIVKEKEDSRIQYVFECGRWLDEGSGETDIEVTLPLTDVVEIAPLMQEEEPDTKTYKDGDWKVYVKTSDESDSGTDSNVTITVYGDADNTGPIVLGTSGVGYFYSGKTDEFDLFLDPEVIGRIRKIRLEHDNSGKPWQVDKVILMNMVDKTQIEFTINKWLTLDKPGFDIAVEVPTEGKDWPVREYMVQTLTGDGFGSGTDARVYINLIGTLGDTGKRFLVHSLEKTEEKFESGQTDTFLIQAVDLGRLMQVQIGHDGQGPGSGWYLKTITVKETYDADEKYVFTCENWLHSDKDDGQTERLLSLDYVDKESARGDQKIENMDDGDTLDNEQNQQKEDNKGENTEQTEENDTNLDDANKDGIVSPGKDTEEEQVTDEPDDGRKRDRGEDDSKKDKNNGEMRGEDDTDGKTDDKTGKEDDEQLEQDGRDIAGNNKDETKPTEDTGNEKPSENEPEGKQSAGDTTENVDKDKSDERKTPVSRAGSHTYRVGEEEE